LSPPDLDALLGQVRFLTDRYKAGRSPDSFEAFRELTDLLFRLTILHPSGGVNLIGGPRRDAYALGGWGGPDDPLPLRNGTFLRLAMNLYLENTPDGPRVKVSQSSLQYQVDRGGGQWIFRYDYLRQPPDPHPSTHLHVRGRLLEPECLPAHLALEDIHFPTQRMSIEAVIRLLVEQFGLPTAEEPDVWRAALAESEAAFHQIAHRSVSGPER
jgi:hypothetical protein